MVTAVARPARLCRESEIRAILRSTRGIRGQHYEIRWRTAASAPRLALIMSRRVGIAVVRNTLKRIAREYFRLHRSVLPNGDYIVRGVSGLTGTRETWRCDLERLFAKIPRKVA